MPTSPNARHEALRRLFDVLTCPVCHDRLEPADQALRCPRRHTFDIARHGYAGLLTGKQRPAGGDTASMVQARTAFLRTGYFAPLTHTLAGLAAELCPPDGTVLDAGVGTGYHLAAVLDTLPDAAGLGLDTSPHALRRAARIHPRATAAGWDIRRPLPVRSRSVDLVLNVFAPRNSPEFHRVLRPGGALLVVTPAPRHLGELQRHLGLLSVDPAKEERLRRTLSARFQRAHTEAVEYVMPLGAQDIEALSSMGPTAHHLDADVLRRRIALLSTPFETAASFVVSVYWPR
ncbi:putative RNA methyltransferase [Streptomyces kebangsaanensis]|uniref:putative RNA methyltransferase n=1 Tax=Streptomyces kebangsaanensis TaxID=864058 RepID=UPI00093AB50E|nr:methyltransferase domain-containing protein [Streptomyces kebangsaanensis]